MKKNNVTKAALILSVCLMFMWGILGAGTSLAWFMDTTPVQKNTFHIGILDLEVYHKLDDGSYETIEGSTSIFDENALYEPGYVQVVFLKIENKGDVDFDYQMSVVPELTSLVAPLNVYGYEIILPEYLRFGVVFADKEEELKELVATRSQALDIADTKLSVYTSEPEMLKAGAEKYAAVVLCMPEYIGNEANYRGDTPPKVDLGITVKATQIGTP